MKRISRWAAVTVALVMAIGMCSTVFGATDDSVQTQWKVSKSKTATNLDKNFESQVTLSLPAEEEELVTDVVFVFDESSCSDPVKEEVKEMLQVLYSHIENKGAVIKIGAVQFRGEVTTFPLTELSAATKESLTAFMGKRPETGGSNMSAGLIAGEKMLDEDTGVSNDRKYLILVSDGITYIWDDEKTETQENYGVNFANSDTPKAPMLASPDGWDVKYKNGYVPENWKNHLDSIGELLDKTIEEKSSAYVRNTDITNNPFVSYAEKDSYLSTVDVALYKSYQAYQSITSKYPHTYAVMTGVEKEMKCYPFGPSFINYLAGDNSVSFETIQKEIYYLLDAGSYVVDEIGKTDDYDFDFINDISKLKLTVGGEELDVTQISDNKYGFGKQDDGSYQFNLTYYKDGMVNGASGECFKWDINVPVTIDNIVQLTYSVKLTNPKTEAGTYGEYDRDGSQGKTALYTNNKAVLYPVSSDDVSGTPEDFNKPTVSYIVQAAQTEPSDSGSEPGVDADVADEEQVSDGAAKTGDDFNPMMCLGVLVLAAAGGAAVLITRKRRNI